MLKKGLRLIIYGRVQGVGYRYFSSKWANRLGIYGWVRNLPDGSVEVVAEGEEALLREFVDKLREGPRFARVREIKEEWLPYQGIYSYFTIE